MQFVFTQDNPSVLDIPYASRDTVRALAPKDHWTDALTEEMFSLDLRSIRTVLEPLRSIMSICMVDVRNLIEFVQRTTQFPPPGRAWELVSCTKYTKRIKAKIKLSATDEKPETTLTLSIPYLAFESPKWYVTKRLPKLYAKREIVRGNVIAGYNLLDGHMTPSKYTYTSRDKCTVRNVEMLGNRFIPVQEVALTSELPKDVWWLTESAVAQDFMTIGQNSEFLAGVPKTSAITGPDGSVYVRSHDGFGVMRWFEASPADIARTEDDAKAVYLKQVEHLREKAQKYADLLTEFLEQNRLSN